MKYVGIDVTHGPGSDTEITKRLIVAFPDDLTHSDVAEALQMVARRTWRKSRVVIGSAGFFNGRMSEVHGKSESLGGLNSDPADAVRFNMADYSGNLL